MKRILMILGNVLIVTIILVLVLVYVNAEQKRILASQTESFENMTIAMENVTTNYLVGEQQVCNTWANYINSSSLTADQGSPQPHGLRTRMITPSHMRTSPCTALALTGFSVKRPW